VANIRPLMVRNQIINALGFRTLKQGKKNKIYVKQLCSCRLLSERERRTENTWAWSSEAGQNHFHAQRERESTSCLHSLHTLSHSYYRLSAASHILIQSAGLLYSGKNNNPTAMKVRPVHIVYSLYNH